MRERKKERLRGEEERERERERERGRKGVTEVKCKVQKEQDDVTSVTAQAQQLPSNSAEKG